MHGAQTNPLPDSQKCLPPPSQCPIPSIPRFVHNLPQYPDCVVITHVLKVDLVYLGERARSGISSWVGEVGREAELGDSGGLPPTKKWPLNEQGTGGRDYLPTPHPHHRLRWAVVPVTAYLLARCVHPQPQPHPS